MSLSFLLIVLQLLGRRIVFLVIERYILDKIQRLKKNVEKKDSKEINVMKAEQMKEKCLNKLC